MVRAAARRAALGLVVGLALLALLGLFAACGEDGGGFQAAIEAEIDVDPPVGPDIKIGPDGSVWLPASDTFQGRPPDEPRHAIVRIDPESNEVAAVIEVPHQMSAVAVTDDAVWATGTDFGPDAERPRGSLVRIDPASNTVVGTIDLGEGASPTDVAVGFGSAWVTDSSKNRVVRVDPTTDEIVAQIAIDGGPASLAVAAGRVWVTKPGAGQLRPIDPVTDTPVEAVSTGPNPEIVEAGEAGLWVADYLEAVLHRVDIEGRSVDESVEFPSAPSRFSVGADTVAVVEAEGRALSIVRDGRRHQLLDERLLVAVALAPGGETVWAVDGGEGRVLRIRLSPA